MDADMPAREAAWMVPVLVFAVTVLGGLAAGLIVWVVNKAVAIALQFRKDVLERLDKQDEEQAETREILSSIRSLLQDEVNKLRTRLSSHGHRIARLEEHNGIAPQRRFDDPDVAD